MLRFRTKGDANEREDGSLVHSRNVIGCPVFTIPKLGYLAEYIQHPPGKYIAVPGASFLLFLLFLPELLPGEEGKKQKKEQGKAPKGVL